MSNAVVVQEVLQRKQELWRWRAQWLAIRSWQGQLRLSSKLILLQLHKMLPNKSMSTILRLFSMWRKLERWKSLICALPHPWPQIKNIFILNCHLLLFYTTIMNNLSIGFGHATKSGFYTTTGDDQLNGWNKKLQNPSQSQTCNKKRSRSLFDGLSWSDPLQLLNPREDITSEKYTQQVDEMHRKLQYLQLALVYRKGPILLHDNTQLHVAQLTLQKLNKLGYGLLSHPPHSPDLLPTDYHFFKHLDDFLQRKHFHTSRRQKIFPKNFLESWSKDFHATGINKLISYWQKCADCNGFYFD